MKLTMKLLVLFFGALMLSNVAYAESPREQLTQMVEQLQKNPNDTALREKIIKLAHEIKPAPAIPEEAERFEGRAQFAFKSAKSPADYLDAAKEYEKAIAAAPWVSGYYSDLCTIYEKAEKYAEAKKNCGFFLASSPSVQEASDVRKRIAGLEFAIEKVSKQKNQGEEFLKKLDGARFVRQDHRELSDSWLDVMYIYEVRGNNIFYGAMVSARSKPNKDIGVINWDDKGGYLIKGREFLIPKDDHLCQNFHRRCFDEIQTIGEYGEKITERLDYDGILSEHIYFREK